MECQQNEKFLPALDVSGEIYDTACDKHLSLSALAQTVHAGRRKEMLVMSDEAIKVRDLSHENLSRRF
jgi:hypothetical protein